MGTSEVKVYALMGTCEVEEQEGECPPTWERLFYYEEEKLKVKMEGFDDARGLRQWWRFGTVTLGSVEVKQLGTIENGAYHRWGKCMLATVILKETNLSCWAAFSLRAQSPGIEFESDSSGWWLLRLAVLETKGGK